MKGWTILILFLLAGLSSVFGKTFYYDLLEFISPVEWTYQTTPTTPGAGKVRFYPKNDDKFYILDSTGAETAVGTGEGAGVFNYIVPNGDAEKGDTSGWNCTGNLSMSNATTTQIFGDHYFTLTAAASSADDYCEYDFDLEGGDTAAMLSAIIERVRAGTGFDTGDASLRLYDKDAAKYINNDSEIYASTIGQRHEAGFQTHASNTNYGLRIVSNVDTTFVFDFDNVKLRREGVQKGVPFTDWESFTPTGSWVTNTSYTGSWRQVGSVAEFNINIVLSGAPTATNLYVNLPFGWTIDSSKLARGASGKNQIGTLNLSDASGNTLNVGYVRAKDTTGVYLQNYTDTTTITATSPWTWATGDEIDIIFRVPISGWQAEASQSSTTLNREIFSRYTSNAGTQAFGAVEIIDFEDIDKDKTNTVTTGAAWKFTAQEGGTYSLNAKIIPYFTNAQTSQEAALFLYKNGVQVERLWYEKFQATRTNFYLTMDGSATIPLEKDDYIDIRGYSSTSGTATLAADAAFNSVSIWKTNTGTEKLFKDAKVYVYAHTSVQNIASGGYTTFIPTVEHTDSHNKFVLGVFTAPSDRKYIICHSNLLTAATGWALGEEYVSQIVATSNTFRTTYKKILTNDAIAAGIGIEYGKCATIPLLTGETAYISLYHNNGAGITLFSGADYNWITIESE